MPAALLLTPALECCGFPLPCVHDVRLCVQACPGWFALAGWLSRLSRAVLWRGPPVRDVHGSGLRASPAFSPVVPAALPQAPRPP